MCAGTSISGGGGGGRLRGRQARAPVVIRRACPLVQCSLIVVRCSLLLIRCSRASVRTSPTAHSAQARVRACPTSRQRHPRSPQAHLGTSSPETLQNCVHQGTNPTDSHRSYHPCPTSERGEDSGLRPGEEARGAARHRDPNSRAHTAIQTRSLLHQIQDTSKIFFI